MESQQINQNNNYDGHIFCKKCADSDSSYDSSSDEEYEMSEQIIYEQGVGEYFSKDEYELECEREYEADRQLYLATNTDSPCWDGLKCFVANLDNCDREELTQMKESIKTMKQQLKQMKDNNIIIMKSYNKIFKTEIFIEQESQQINECAVCFNDCKLVNFPAREDTQCKHTFCDKCIEQVDKCPMCREYKRPNKLTRRELYHHAISTPIHQMKFNFSEWNRK
jgi:hypothetical protein